jgi:transposase
MRLERRGWIEPMPAEDRRRSYRLTHVVARASDIPELKGFATKLRQDQDAVVAALALPYNQGQTDGFITTL